MTREFGAFLLVGGAAAAVNFGSRIKLSLFMPYAAAIVVEGERFLGLITRIDLLNYLRRRVQ